MKTLIKVLTALAAAAGIIYAIATYGEQIVAWAKNLLAKFPQCPCCEEDVPAVDPEEAPAAGEAPAEEVAVESVEETPAEAPATEPVISEHEPVAEDNDFAE